MAQNTRTFHKLYQRTCPPTLVCSKTLPVKSHRVYDFQTEKKLFFVDCKESLDVMFKEK